MNDRVRRLQDAQRKAETLFSEAEQRGYITAGQTEIELNTKLYRLAQEIYGIRKYWHRRIVRAGRNTLSPYREFPPNLLIAPNDILFLDFGPVFEDWEADVGRTYVVGDDPVKRRLQAATVAAWHEGKAYFKAHPDVTGAELYAFSTELAKRYGWSYGGPHAGHLIGNFPHESIQGDEVENYIHPENQQRMRDHDRCGMVRDWIYEIHLVDYEREIGGFFEQLLTED
jgi:Xaa-Pro dipeptidase